MGGQNVNGIQRNARNEAGRNTLPWKCSGTERDGEMVADKETRRRWAIHILTGTTGGTVKGYQLCRADQRLGKRKKVRSDLPLCEI